MIGLILIGAVASLFNTETEESDARTDPTSSTDTPESPETLSPVTDSFDERQCIKVSEDLLESISLGITDSTATGRAAGFDAKDFAQLTFIAVEFIPNGTSDEIVAVFATNDSDISDSKLDGLIIAVDGFAKNFSNWGTPLDVDISLADRGALDAKECVSLPGMTLAPLPGGPSSFDEDAFIKQAGEDFGQFDQTFDDGSTLTVMGKARAICDGSLAVMKGNLGDQWETSFNKFVIDNFCPNKVN